MNPTELAVALGHWDDRSRDVSDELGEVRTVLNRARTAIDRLESEWGHDTYDDPEVMAEEPVKSNFPDRETFLDAWREWSDRRYAARMVMADQDLDDMLAALRRTVASLERWDRAGKRRRR